MNEKKLFELTNNLSRKYFNQPFMHTVKYNNRLQSTGGRYIPSQKVIEINPKYVLEMEHEDVIGIIKHELCHYHLHIIGKPFKDSDPEFIHLLNVVDAPKYCAPLPSAMKRHIYVCKKCGTEYKRQRHVNTHKYKCGRCRGDIYFLRTVNIADNI